ncbi:MAG: UDP-N-acetylglucosamine--N-acetylmuramyl-(pentapeptide) pyrophosphoryl-undecaprenol N-acetylglucosamine transferase, partial [Oscillospiraceae bacterium]
LSGHTANKILKNLKPDLVIGTGGYVSGPIVRAAAKMGIKTAIHEQNAFPGVTNKLLAKDVDVVFAAVEAAREKLGAPEKTVVCGNPVRQNVYRQDREAARKKLGIKEDTVLLVSFGGSLGARRINEAVASLCDWHLKNRKFRHIHATGSYGVDLFKELSTKYAFYGNVNLDVREYIDDMAVCLAAADLVICRAGALTLAELAAVGRASILIPSPNVAENHQYFNALEMEKVGSAKVIEEKDLTDELLIATVDELTKDPKVLVQMGKNAKKCAVENSLSIIYEHLMPFLK